MGSVFVVVSAPILHLFPGVGKAHEPVSVEAVLTDLAVERLDEGAVGRLALAREVQGDTALVRPKVEVARDKFGALIDPDRPWVANTSAGFVQRSDHVFAPITEAGIDDR